MKRVLTLILTVLLLLSLTLPAAAAGKIKASTMRLELIEGSATVLNSSGVKQSYNAGMRLYSGYSITTAKDSYAYISLDDEKAVKLDMLTTVSIRQSGKKLQIQLTTGQVFADVTAPLAADESLEIRTSTMVTGIRGSSAVVSTWPLRGETDVRFLTGHGSVIDYSEAAAPEIALTGGEGYLNENGDGEKYDCEQGDYPAFALEELLTNPYLRDELDAEGVFRSEELTENLDEQFRQEAEARAAEMEALDAEAAEEGEEEEEPSDEPGPEPTAAPLYSVTFPEENSYFTVETVSTDRDGGCRFRVRPTVGYEDSTFLVSANGKVLTDADGVYAVENLTEDVTVTVEATPVATEYTIYYTLNDGVLGEAEDNPETYTIESEDITLNAPTKEGYTFLGWTGTNQGEAAVSVVIPAGSTGDRNYEANWQANSYDVSFSCGEGYTGDAPEPVSVTYRSAYGLLPVPAMIGYDFEGWYLDADLSEEQLVTSETVVSSAADHTLYALFRLQTFTVSWELPETVTLCRLPDLPGEVGEVSVSDGVRSSSGTATVNYGEDFIFDVQCFDTAVLVYANGTPLEVADWNDFGEVYVIPDIAADQSITVKPAAYCWLSLPEEYALNLTSGNALQEAVDGGVELTLLMNETVSFTLLGDALVMLNGTELEPVDGAYSFSVSDQKDFDLRVTPLVTVKDGTLASLRTAMVEAAETERAVMIDCNISIPANDEDFIFDVPVILAKGRQLTLAVNTEISSEFLNNGTVRVLEYAALYIGEGSYFSNCGSIIVNAHASFSNYGNLDNAESGVITLCGDTSLNSPQPARMHNEGYVQDSGTVVCEGELNNIGEYLLWTSDLSVFRTEGSQLVLPYHVSEVIFMGSLTVQRGQTLYLSHASLYFGDKATLTVSAGASAYIEIDPYGAMNTALVMDNGSELVLDGSITTNNTYGFRDNENRWVTEQVLDAPSLTYQVVSAAPAS